MTGLFESAFGKRFRQKEAKRKKAVSMKDGGYLFL